MIRQTTKNLSVLLLLMFVIASVKAEPFVFMTSWTGQAQFAGYYAAYEKGFYREAGLDVKIEHPTLSTTPLYRLTHEKYDGIMLSLMTAIDFISQGHQLVNIFQDSMNSSNMLISRWDTDPLKMKGKKVAIFNPDPNYLAMILSRQKGLNYDFIPFTSHINLFLSGAIDATMAVSYNEYLQLLQSGLSISKESIYRFSDNGYNIQEHGIYVSKSYYLANRDKCRKFAEASRKGWEWVFTHQEEALKIVMKYARADNADTNRTLQKLMLKEVLRLQQDPDSKKREYRLRPDMVNKACRLMKEYGLIKRTVTYKELTGQ